MGGTYSFLSLCKDILHFLFTILHLLLTRILPLLAILLISLLLHVFHLISSAGSTKSSLFKQRRPLQGRPPLGDHAVSLAVYHDALQEDVLDHQSSPAYSLQEEEEGYEDCIDEFTEEQLSPMSKEYEESSNYGERTENGGLRDVMGDVQKKSGKVVPDSPKEERRGPGSVGDSLQEVGDLLQDGHSLEGESDSLQEVGDSQSAPVQIATLQSQPSLFPSDLPPSLDLIVRAATTQTAASKPTSRALPPTLSDIQKALQESSGAAAPPKRSPAPTMSNPELEEAAMPDPPALRRASYGNFLVKFNQHFMVDGQG